MAIIVPFMSFRAAVNQQLISPFYTIKLPHEKKNAERIFISGTTSDDLWEMQLSKRDRKQNKKQKLTIDKKPTVRAGMLNLHSCAKV